MNRLLLPFLLITLLTILGCDDYVTYQDPPYERLDPDSVGVGTNTIYLDVDDSSETMFVYNYSDRILSWGPQIYAFSTTDGIDILFEDDTIQPYDSTALHIHIDRWQFESYNAHGEISLSVEGEIVETIEITIQVIDSEAVPIGVKTHNYNLPANRDAAFILLCNNSDESWDPDPEWPGGFTISETWIEHHSLEPYPMEIAPGSSATLLFMVDRTGLDPGYHECHLDLYWYDEIVQTIRIRIEVGE
jgi:hypothetical protein